MDPDATLIELRALAGREYGGDTLDEDETFRLAELIHNLDEWLTRGGFLPTDWNALRG
jgi:hypothetical protein